MKRLIISLVAILALAACKKHVAVPSAYSESNTPVDIYPDYQEVTIPENIAPMNFYIDTEADGYVTRIKNTKGEWTYGKRSVIIDPEDWEVIKSDKTITIDIFTQKGGKWAHHKTFSMYVCGDRIDPYLTYRLIAPSYVTFENLTLNQRCLENCQEDLIYGNMINSVESDGQCINCHTSQCGNPKRTQFHVRQGHGGTVINMDGNVKKVNLKVPSTISAGVYPAWHPKNENLIAYSTNNTGQSFHTYDKQKIEVLDTYSDLILYNIQKNEVMPLEHDSMELDCFPAWSPDGNYLYYCSAHYEKIDSVDVAARDVNMFMRYKDLHYNLYRRQFDQKTLRFGPREMVYDCADTCSATLPRISPDGRYLLFTRGDYGVFHIWHTSSDLYMIDLNTGNVRVVKELNSPDVESYHTWSTTGKWIVFSSRREDGNFTRPFFAHFKSDGTFTKPFELPQADPLYHRQFLRSYNIPEFLTGPVEVSPQEFAEVIIGDSVQAQCNEHADGATGASKVK